MKKTSSGFTLIETMVAIALLMVALVPPMSLAAQSLSDAYYARDQITAFYLAQEGIEIVRSVRDGNIIAIAGGQSDVDIFNGIPLNQPFTVDSLNLTSNALYTCQSSGCPPLQTNGSVYGYDPDCPSSGNQWQTTDCATQENDGWTNTIFTRTINAYLINPDDPDEMRVTVSVTWQEGSFQSRTFTINEDLYRWVSNESET